MRFLLIIVCLISCQNTYQEKVRITEFNTRNTDFLIDVNKKFLESEEKQIDSILQYSNYNFDKKKSGLRIWIDKSLRDVDSPYAKKGNQVQFLFECVLLNGNIQILNNHIYTGYLTDTVSFKLGFSKQMQGLNYAIKLLKVGDKAKIIIPSYIGFGGSGFGKSVPPHSTLLLNVQLLNLE